MATLIERVTDLFKEKLEFADTDVVPKSTITSQTQPDIEYHPDEVKWKARTARRLAEDPTLPSQPLPEGFPSKLESPLVWEGKDWTDAKQWEFELNEEHLREIDDAVKHFNGE